MTFRFILIDHLKTFSEALALSPRSIFWLERDFLLIWKAFPASRRPCYCQWALEQTLQHKQMCKPIWRETQLVPRALCPHNMFLRLGLVWAHELLSDTSRIFILSMCLDSFGEYGNISLIRVQGLQMHLVSWCDSGFLSILSTTCSTQRPVHV